MKKLLVTFAVVLAMAVLSSTVIGQNQKKSQSKKVTTILPGVVLGRVFGITKGGDIKPARMAKVFLIPESLPVPPEESIIVKIADVSLKIAEEQGEDVKNHKQVPDELYCAEELALIDVALSTTVEQSLKLKNAKQAIVGEADEEGNFRITDIPPGDYYLYARGRAGFNDAFWSGQAEYEHFTVTAGKESTIKLSSPQKSCLKLADEK